MRTFKKQSDNADCSFIKQIFTILFLLCFPIIISCSKDENEKKEIVGPSFSQEDIRHEENLNTYLHNNYSCVISSVIVTESSVKINGRYIGDGTFCLGEIPPYVDVMEVKRAPYKISLVNSSFQIEIERFVEREGFLYDRLLSKWAVFKEGIDSDQLVSHAHYVDEIPVTQDLTPLKLTSKKGLGGIIANQYISDFALLNISSATINVCITHFMHLIPREGDIEYIYGGKSYYMDEGYLRNTLDVALLAATKKRNISVAAIILVEPAARCTDPELGKLLQHPDNDGGVYTMPNMTTPEAVNCYAAALDFLAKRYCTIGNRNGRISHWIMHNEVDGGKDWANMGLKPVTVFTDTYVKSMRMCYNIVRQYDAHAEVFASFSHSWTEISNPEWYTCKEIIDILNMYSQAEGDFQWALAYHSYAQDLTNPCTWLDPNATYSMNTSFVTFKNLEVLNKWALAKENRYKGSIKRSIWLSEAGVNSRSYSDEDLQKQAAGFAYAWKKINALEGIDGIQWHNWFDNQVEGACLGLRKYLDATYNGEAKPVWSVFQKADTPAEDEYFEQFLPLIGIPDWNIIENF